MVVRVKSDKSNPKISMNLVIFTLHTKTQLENTSIFSINQ